MISSPCTKVCVVDGVTGLCFGCGRTLPEIAKWGSLSEAERLAIMATLGERKSLLVRSSDSIKMP